MARSRQIYWLIAILIIVSGLVGWLIFQFVSANKHPASENCEGGEIEMFRTQLDLLPADDLENRKNVAGKIDAWETMVAVCESVTPMTKIIETTPQFIQEITPTLSTGIFEGQPGAYFHAFEAKIENHWKGIINGNPVLVFAGAWANEPSQGFIAVKTSPSKGQAIWGYYPSAAKSGALRIIDVKGARLILQQANDKNFLFFDVPSLSFVNSLEEVVIPITPTGMINTPQPMTTPYPYPIP
jgi:hypothetical protein